jgi:hypothetical protein
MKFLPNGAWVYLLFDVERLLLSLGKEMGSKEDQQGLKWTYTDDELADIQASGEQWRNMPDEIRLFRKKVLEDMGRFDLEDISLLMSALVHPGYHSLKWIRSTPRRSAIKMFLKEMCSKSGVEFSDTQYSRQLFDLTNIETPTVWPFDLQVDARDKRPKFRHQFIDELMNNSDSDDHEDVAPDDNQV